jgi:N6-adenosine-specific RNA methylase IME4
VTGVSVLARVLALNAGAPYGCDVRRSEEPFRVVCADPPWPIGDRLPGAARGAARNYDLVSLDDLCRRRFVGGDLLHAVADDALLFLWRLSSMVEEAYQVCRAWGFVPKAEVVWNKLTPSGKPWFGMGRTVRLAHEVCVVGVRGRALIAVDNNNVRSTFAAKVPRERVAGRLRDGTGKIRYVHSAKPERFYSEVVERLSAGPYLELFARPRTAGYVDDSPPRRCPWARVGAEMHAVRDQLRRADLDAAHSCRLRPFKTYGVRDLRLNNLHGAIETIK